MPSRSRPTTSGSSHLLEGVFLGVSRLNRNQKSHELPGISTRFRFRPGEPVNQYLTIRSCEFTSLLLRRQLPPPLRPPEAPTAPLRKLQKVPIDAVHISVITKSKLLFGVEVSPRRQEDHAAHNEYLRLA